MPQPKGLDIYFPSYVETAAIWNNVVTAKLLHHLGWTPEFEAHEEHVAHGKQYKGRLHISLVCRTFASSRQTQRPCRLRFKKRETTG